LNPPDTVTPSESEPLPPELADALARGGDRLKSFVRDVRWFPRVPSTNDAAAAEAERGAPDGTVIVAGSQSAGRGRHGRVWQSPAGSGLYTSILLRPTPNVLPLITIAAGVALGDGIRASTGIVTTLKWPNDVYIGSRKLAGILAEVGTSSSGASHVILGFGVNLRPGVYPADVEARATSLEAEAVGPVDAGVVLRECLAALAARYDDLRSGRADIVIDAWRTYARPLLGRAVEWDERGTPRRGVAQNVDATGALLVKTDEGVMRLVSGEVRWI
jgi:BirA family biotin operon repressor/biotin-[acetyl-CoA-carboxylase] ligase